MKSDTSTSDSRLIRIIRFSTALSVGLMSGFLYSIKQVSPDLRCEFSPGTPIAFLAGAAFTWVFWRIAFNRDESGEENNDSAALVGRRVRWRLFLALSVLLSLGTVAAFAFALRGIGNDRLLEVLEGTAIAVVALSGVGLLLWMAARFLEKDNKRTLQERDEGE